MKEATKIEKLWAPWRLEHIRKHSLKGDDEACVFCELVKSSCDVESLKLYQGKNCFVIMNRFPYNPNHLMVIPNSHIGMLPDVKGETWDELQACLKATVDLMMERVKPHGL